MPPTKTLDDLSRQILKSARGIPGQEVIYKTLMRKNRPTVTGVNVLLLRYVSAESKIFTPQLGEGFVSANVVEWTNCAMLCLQGRDPWLLADDAWAMASALGQRVGWGIEPESAVVEAFHHEAFAVQGVIARPVSRPPDLRRSPYASAEANGTDRQSIREIAKHILSPDAFSSTREFGNGA